MAASAPPDQHTPLRGGDPEGADVSDPDSPQTRLAGPVLGVNDVAWMEKTEAKLETKEEELKADKKKLEAEKEELKAEKEELVQQRQTFMTHMSVEDDFSLYQLLQSPQVEQWKKDYFVGLNKKLEHVNAQLATTESAYCTVVTMQAQALQKRYRESTGAAPGATRVRASSPGTPVPTGVLQLHQTTEEHSSQALSAQARDLYESLRVEEFTFDYDFDNEDDSIHEPLIEVFRQRCAETLEGAVAEYIVHFAEDLFPVRCRSEFYFRAEYSSARGTQCVHESIPDMLVFLRTDKPSKELTASNCRQHKPLLIEVQSGSRTLEESKVRLATTLFSFVKHPGADVDTECVYGIVVEKSLERIHVVRFKSGKYETDGSFPARCLVDICRKVLHGAG